MCTVRDAIKILDKDKGIRIAINEGTLNLKGLFSVSGRRKSGVMGYAASLSALPVTR